MRQVRINPVSDDVYEELERQATVLNVTVDEFCCALLSGYTSSGMETELGEFVRGWCAQHNTSKELRELRSLPFDAIR